MMELVSRNVALKPANRRQINAWLRRSLRLGQQVGSLVTKFSIERTGRSYEVRADIQDRTGTIVCRSREHELMDACRSAILKMALYLHNQRLQQLA